MTTMFTALTVLTLLLIAIVAQATGLAAGSYFVLALVLATYATFNTIQARKVAVKSESH